MKDVNHLKVLIMVIYGALIDQLNKKKSVNLFSLTKKYWKWEYQLSIGMWENGNNVVITNLFELNRWKLWETTKESFNSRI